MSWAHYDVYTNILFRTGKYKSFLDRTSFSNFAQNEWGAPKFEANIWETNLINCFKWKDKIDKIVQ